jgi:hypothetical protein
MRHLLTLALIDAAPFTPVGDMLRRTDGAAEVMAIEPGRRRDGHRRQRREGRRWLLTLRSSVVLVGPGAPGSSGPAAVEWSHQ